MPLTGPSQSQTPAPCPSCRTHASCVLVELSPPRIMSPPMLMHPPWSLSCPCRVVPSHAPAPPASCLYSPPLFLYPISIMPLVNSLLLPPDPLMPLYPTRPLHPPAPTHANVPSYDPVPSQALSSSQAPVTSHALTPSQDPVNMSPHTPRQLPSRIFYPLDSCFIPGLCRAVPSHSQTPAPRLLSLTGSCTLPGLSQTHLPSLVPAQCHTHASPRPLSNLG